MVLFVSSFSSGSSTPLPIPVPDYTMIDIYDPPTCYALKIYCTGDIYWPETGSSSEYIVYSPYVSSVWNMSGKFSYSSGITAYVYVKWYSYSSWSLIGSMESDDADADITYYGDFLSRMIFYYNDLVNP